MCYIWYTSGNGTHGIHGTHDRLGTNGAHGTHDAHGTHGNGAHGVQCIQHGGKRFFLAMLDRSFLQAMRKLS